MLWANTAQYGRANPTMRHPTIYRDYSFTSGDITFIGYRLYVKLAYKKPNTPYSTATHRPVHYPPPKTVTQIIITKTNRHGHKAYKILNPAH